MRNSSTHHRSSSESSTISEISGKLNIPQITVQTRNQLAALLSKATLQNKHLRQFLANVPTRISIMMNIILHNSTISEITRTIPEKILKLRKQSNAHRPTLSNGVLFLTYILFIHFLRHTPPR